MKDIKSFINESQQHNVIISYGIVGDNGLGDWKEDKSSINVDLSEIRYVCIWVNKQNNQTGVLYLNDDEAEDTFWDHGAAETQLTEYGLSNKEDYEKLQDCKVGECVYFKNDNSIWIKIK